MIIECINCDKKFDVKSSLIPENGRLLQCSACDHKWFFKKKILAETTTPIKANNPINETENQKEVIEAQNIEHQKTMELLDKLGEDRDTVKEKILIKDKNNQNNSEIKKYKDRNFATTKSKKNYNILGKIIVFIISFVALIILLDTFQGAIIKIFPNFEIVLYNLYESIKDIVLFFKDLI